MLLMTTANAAMNDDQRDLCGPVAIGHHAAVITRYVASLDLLPSISWVTFYATIYQHHLYAYLLVHGQVIIIFVFSVCLSVCLFVRSFSQPSLIRSRSNLDICYTSGSSCVP